MQKFFFLTLLLCYVFFSTHDAGAQEPQPKEPAKIEVGFQFLSLNTGQKVYPELSAVDLPTSDAGFEV